MPDPDPTQPSLPSELEGLDPADLLARGLKSNRPPSGATGWMPPTPEELAVLLPQYQIESLLGHGGMGAVYKGLQPTLDRAVAIKLLPVEMAEDEHFISRFQREARTLARLHHPSIVAVHDFGRTSAGHLYFVMEYVDGMDLRRVLRTSGLPPDDALKVIVQICDALQAAHKQGVVHRDIKPENILLTTEGYVKLVDFGIARPMDEEFGRLTNSGMMIGTPDYMSPEQRTGEVDERTDIYALGVVLYELLTGRPPRGVFPAPSRRVQIDVRIDEVVLKALQDDPEARYQKVSDMKTDVDRIRTTSAPTAEPAAPPPPPMPTPRRWNLSLARWSVVTLAALLLVAIGSYGISRFIRTPAPTSAPAPTPTPPTPGGADWHVPGLNDASFGGWYSFGDGKLDAHDGIITITNQAGWTGIASTRDDFSPQDIHLELAGSPDAQAWIGVILTGRTGDWSGLTSYVNGHDGQVAAGHMGKNFSTTVPRVPPGGVETGSGRVDTPANEFFSLDYSFPKPNEIHVWVNGRETSVVRDINWRELYGQGPPKGQFAVFVGAGSLRIRRIELRKHVPAPVAVQTPSAPTTTAVAMARTLAVPGDFSTIQAAIDAARPGDTVTVAEGDYQEQLVFKAGINLAGAGMVKSTVHCSATLGSVLTAKNSASGVIADLGFEHTGAAPGVPDASGVRLAGCAVEVRRCGIRHAGGNGIECTEEDRSTVADCDVSFCRLEGIMVAGNDASPRLLSNHSHDNGLGGIEFVRGSSGRAEGNVCERNGKAGLYATDAQTNPTFFNNRAINNQFDGIAVVSGATAWVEGNVCEDNHTDGIFLRGPQPSVTVLNNQVRRNRTHGIWLWDKSNALVEGNLCEKNTNSGISVHSADIVATLKANQCLDNNDFGINMPSSSRITVENDNTLLRNKKGVFGIDGAASATLPTASPAASAPTPARVGTPGLVSLDTALPGTRWSMGRWTLNFKENHIIMVEEGSPPLRTWHWWTLDMATIHIQYAAQGGQYNPDLGANLVFDPERTQYTTQGSDPEKAQKGQRLGPAPAGAGGR